MVWQNVLPHLNGRYGSIVLSQKQITSCRGHHKLPSQRNPCAGSGGPHPARIARPHPLYMSYGATAGRVDSDLPQDWRQVVAWSRSEFRRCVAPELHDSGVHLAKCCLLVALEEEAARSGVAPHPELQELMEMVATSGSLSPRSAASASTWSGERLEALAAEVAALLDRQLEESTQYRAAAGAGAGAAEPSGVKAGDAVLEPPSSEPHLHPEGGPGYREEEHEGAGQEAGEVIASSSFDFAAEQEQLLDRIHTSRPGAVGSSSGSSSSREKSNKVAGGGVSSGADGDVAAGGDLAMSSSSSSGGEGDKYYGSAWPSGRRQYGRRRALYRQYPVQTLAAVNTVLFDRHGYQPCNRYGVPSDHQLSAVLERGVGASAALSVLYLEVCERLGFPLAARPLEDGRYFVLWPLEAPLTADGQRFLVDPYGRGGLLLMDEVCDIFGVDAASLRPASRRELLAALVGELRDAHWAAAAGCSPQPGSMTPLSVDTALANKVVVAASGVRAAALRRALAAAEKRLWLLPDDSEAQLQYGLLLYFSRRYDDAWIELSLYLERFAVLSNGPGTGSGGGGGNAVSQPQETQALAAIGSGGQGAATTGGDCVAGEVTEVNGSSEAPVGIAEATLMAGGAAETEGRESHDAIAVAADPGDTGADCGADNSKVLMPVAGDEEAKVPLNAMVATAAAAEPGGQGRDTSMAAKVAVLVERIRLVLDFAPTQPAA